MSSLVDVAVGGHSHRWMVPDRRKFQRRRFEDVVHRTGIVDHIDLRGRRTDWSFTCRLFGSKVRAQDTAALAGRPHDCRMGIMSVAVGECEYDLDDNFVKAKLTACRV